MDEDNVERVRATVRPRDAGDEGGAGKEGAPGAPEAPPAPAPPGRLVRCPVCEGAGDEVPGEGEDRICRCSVCQVLFRNPRPSIGRMREIRRARFAGAVGRMHAAKQRGDRLLAIEVMKGYHGLASGRPAPLNAFGKRLLEIGCDLGFRMREFEKYGWTILGTETAPGALEYVRATMLEVLESGPEEIPKGRGPFDLILLDGVLGEVADPKGLAAALPGHLSRNGVVCASVPETETGEPDLPGGAAWGFSEDALRRLFMEAGAEQPATAHVEGRLLAWFRFKDGRR